MKKCKRINKAYYQVQTKIPVPSSADKIQEYITYITNSVRPKTKEINSVQYRGVQARPDLCTNQNKIINTSSEAKCIEKGDVRSSNKNREIIE